MADARHRRSSVVRWLAGALGLIAASVVAVWWLAHPQAPDGFYLAPGDQLPGPATILRTEAFGRDVPVGARAWRILYSTTRGDGRPAVASAVVVAPGAAKAPLPVVAWAHGTTGIVPGCAPSLMRHPFANVPGLTAVLRQGWAFVATDYVGLGTAGSHRYLVGEDAARAVLDSVRAARRLQDITLDERTVVWGHSQGGHSALWTGIGAAYAPEVSIRGVAAFAPASDLPALAASAQRSMFGKIVTSYLAVSYGNVYPDVAAADVIRPVAMPFARDIARRCVGEWPTLVSVAETLLLPRDGIFAGDPTAGALGARLRENTPVGPIASPVLIAQGEADDLVLPEIQSRYVSARCAAGQQIDFRRYPGLDHLTLVADVSPLVADAIAWTSERLAGVIPQRRCPP